MMSPPLYGPARLFEGTMKFLVADDHMLIRQALSAMLECLDDEVRVVEAGGFDDALEIIAGADSFDAALVDLDMPGPPWRVALPKIREMLPDLPIIILSGSEARTDIVEALRLGARGYIPKSSNVTVMRAAVELVLSGGTYLPPHLLSHAEAEVPEFAAGTRRNHLTPRQRQILAELQKGLSNKEIARNLGLSEGTVKLHVTALLKVLNVANRTQAVLAAERLGIEPGAGS